MADAVFSACFLNACNRHCDVVKMANFAPTVNTRGCIFTYDEGIVLRSTYHAVSYTHLDVYKRQAQHTAEIGNIADGFI